MRRLSLVLIAALVCVALAAPPHPANAVSARPPRRCAGATLARQSARTRDAVPVLFVHGFLGSPGDFRREQNHRSMLDTVSAIDGVAAYTFDYTKHASQWVTDQAIGPALARSIRCLARALDHKVTVVAHSMGGLATRLAQGQVLNGHAVADSLERVVTIGTPTRGVILLTATTSGISKRVLQTVVDAAGKLCTKPPKQSRRHLCALLDAANAPATSAMTPGSAALAALPAWGDGVIVHPIAGDLQLRVSAFGLGTTTSLGDIVATVGSATADASPGQHPLVVKCHTELSNLDNVVDASPCAHGNLTSNRRIIAGVYKQVEKAVGAEARKRPIA